MEENDEAALALVSAQEEYRKMVLALETKQRELESHNTDLVCFTPQSIAHHII